MAAGGGEHVLDLTICLDCGASNQGILPACPDCLSAHIDHIAQLQPGEVIYACGRCAQHRRLGPPENPAVNQTRFGRIRKGAVLQLPLTTWNTVFKCEGCRGWNWVTLDERITGFELACPDCGEQSVFETLGRRLVFSKKLWEPVVLGEWRRDGKPVKLKCGHSFYLPKLVVEGSTPATGATQAPRATSQSATSAADSAPGKKRTQPIPPESLNR